MSDVINKCLLQTKRDIQQKLFKRKNMTQQVNCKKRTRKLSYRKDDRAMRPMYGRPENFQESLTTHTATSPEFLMGFCSD